MSDSSKSADAMVAVDIMTFRNATREIDFDVYMKLSSENTAHVFSRTTGIDYKRLAQYIQKGIKELYIKKEAVETYKRFMERPAQTVFTDPNSSQEKKIASLLNMTDKNLAEIFTQFTVEENTAVSTQKVIKNYVSIMVQSPETLSIILKLVSHGDYRITTQLPCRSSACFLPQKLRDTLINEL